MQFKRQYAKHDILGILLCRYVDHVLSSALSPKINKYIQNAFDELMIQECSLDVE